MRRIAVISLFTLLAVIAAIVCGVWSKEDSIGMPGMSTQHTSDLSSLSPLQDLSFPLAIATEKAPSSPPPSQVSLFSFPVLLETSSRPSPPPLLTNNWTLMELTSYIRHEVWKRNKALHAPSDFLQEHIKSMDRDHRQDLPWLVDARRLIASGSLKEAADGMIDRLKRDRAYLAFLTDDIDLVAYDLISPLIEAGNHDTALDLITACCVASGDPVAYLRKLLTRMPEESIRSIWDGDPCVTLASFDTDQYLGGMWVMADFQERESLSWSIDPVAGHNGKGSMRIDAGGSAEDGETVVGWRDHPYSRMSPGDAGIRLYIRSERPEPVEVLLHCRGLFGNEMKVESLLRLPLPAMSTDGWLCFDTTTLNSDMFDAIIEAHGWNRPWIMEELEAADIQEAQLFLTNIGLCIPPGEENTYWIDRVELVIPYGKWKVEPRVALPTRFLNLWRQPRQTGTRGEITEEVLEQMAEFQAMGYIGAVSSAPDLSGVTIYTEGKAHPGVNFIVDGSTNELKLISMSGRILHRWRPRLDDPGWPAEDFSLAARENTKFRRGHLFPNGDVLAVNDGRSIIKLDRHSDIRWAKAGGYHHDLRIMDDGTIYVLYREWESVPLAGHGDSTLVDYVMILDEDGNELHRVSVLKALERSHHASYLNSLDYEGDILHTNSIQVLDGQLSDRIPAFRKGNVLVCIPLANMIAVIDMETERVVWALSGMWTFPHDPKLLPNDNMLIFDNAGPAWHWILSRASRVVEFSPLTQEIVWEYTGTPENPFYSDVCGAAWRLPNDNVLITETIKGRVFEVTRDKAIVWEYVNTERSGENGELVGVINELIRYPLDYSSSWLDPN